MKNHAPNSHPKINRGIIQTTIEKNRKETEKMTNLAADRRIRLKLYIHISRLSPTRLTRKNKQIARSEN